MGRSPKERRRIKLIKPRLQLKLVGIFVGLSMLGFVLQALLTSLFLSETAATMPEGGPYLMALLPGLPLEILLVSFGLFLPLTIAVGIVVTFRIAGPVYRFEQYLSQVARGEDVGPCRLRKGDELQELCDVINRAVEPMRAAAGGEDQESDAEREPLRRAG